MDGGSLGICQSTSGSVGYFQSLYERREVGVAERKEKVMRLEMPKDASTYFSPMSGNLT